MKKQEFYRLVIEIANSIDTEILLQHQAYFGGGTMLSLEADTYRMSYVLDFICNQGSFNRLRRWFYDNQLQQLFGDRNIEVGEVISRTHCTLALLAQQPQLEA